MLAGGELRPRLVVDLVARTMPPAKVIMENKWLWFWTLTDSRGQTGSRW